MDFAVVAFMDFTDFISLTDYQVTVISSGIEECNSKIQARLSL
jgi:hypothetical protein